ncbi:MAG: hypothetical protein RIC55_08495 [Pirellulaceae bacterium]
MQRRDALKSLAALAGLGALSAEAADAAPPRYRLSTFSADVTPPLGHPLIAGWRQPAKTIKDRLTIKGVCLTGAGQPLVIAGLDWCELRNDSYDAWRDALARAAGTTRERVLLSCVHQHDAPYADLTAQKLLDEVGLEGEMFDVAFHNDCVERSAAALKKSLATARPVTHFGAGQAKVERVACNRRVQLKGQPPRFNRYSAARDPQIRFAADGEIDPLVKTLAFYDGEQPLAAVSCYAVHPMSYYGGGEVSYDFPGMAREMRQRETPEVMQIYLSGCAGDVVAAKYNDGGAAGRQALAEHLHDGMRRAWESLERRPLERVAFRNVPMTFEPESQGNLSLESLQSTLENEKLPGKTRSQAALGLSWHRRCAAGQRVDLPAVDFGAAKLLLLPAEAFVGFQLAAQQMEPDAIVMTPAYGECAPGYFPTAKTRGEGFVEEHGYCWVAAGAEKELLRGIGEALRGQ